MRIFSIYSNKLSNEDDFVRRLKEKHPNMSFVAL